MKDESRKFIQQLSEYELLTLDEVSLRKIEELLNLNYSVKHNHDRPDIPFIYDDKIIALEEFEFDSSHTKKDSSMQKKEIANLDRNRVFTEEPIVQNYPFENNGTIDMYKKNLIRSFSDHIANYEVYLGNINKIAKGKKIEFGFVIDNSSIMPDLLKRNGDLSILTPFRLPEVINIFRTNPWIEHVFYVFNNLDKRQILYFNLSDRNLDFYENKENYYDELLDEYIQFQAKSLSVNIKIPRKKDN